MYINCNACSNPNPVIVVRYSKGTVIWDASLGIISSDLITALARVKSRCWSPEHRYYRRPVLQLGAYLLKLCYLLSMMRCFTGDFHLPQTWYRNALGFLDLQSIVRIYPNTIHTYIWVPSYIKIPTLDFLAKLQIYSFHAPVVQVRVPKSQSPNCCMYICHAVSLRPSVRCWVVQPPSKARIKGNRYYVTRLSPDRGFRRVSHAFCVAIAISEIGGRIAGVSMYSSDHIAWYLHIADCLVSNAGFSPVYGWNGVSGFCSFDRRRIRVMLIIRADLAVAADCLLRCRVIFILSLYLKATLKNCM